MSRITKWKLEKTKVKVVFRLQFHATHIPQTGWDKLFISFIPADSTKAIAKTTKANVRSGSCKWADPIYETTRLLQDIKTKQVDDKFYKLVIAMGSSRSSVLGEANINLAHYADALKPCSVALPLQGCDSGTILHVAVQLLTSKTGFREFELQRELRERGLPDESAARKIYSAEDTINDPIDKVNSRVRFKEELPPLEEEAGLNEEYADSAVGFDGSSSTSGSLYAERHDISSTHEIDSLKSSTYGDLVGPILSQSPQREKGDPSNHRFLPHGSSNWAHGWGSDYSADNDLANAYEENNRLRRSLETAESSILDLKLEVSSLQSHANEIGSEAHKFAQLLATEMASGEQLVKEVSVLRLESSKFKADLAQLKNPKLNTPFTIRQTTETDQDASFQELQLRWVKGLLHLEDKIKEVQSKACFGFHERDVGSFNLDIEALLGVLEDLKQGTGQAISGMNSASVKEIRELNLRKGQQVLPGTRFSADFYQPEGMLHSLDIPALVSQEDAHSAMKGKTFELIKELDELKAEREGLARKMDQMECYYEALVQELEENQRQMMGELQNLRNDHSTCLYTISATKAEMENIRQDMNKKIMKFAEEKCDLETLNKDHERRATTAEAALKRARLNYSIAVNQLQKDLELLSCQVLSMYETNENLIKQAFSDSSTPRVLGYEVIENKKLDSKEFQSTKLSRSKHQFDAVKKQDLDGDIVSEDLKRSLLLQKGLYQKVEEEIYEAHLVNVYLDIFSKTLQETVLEANADFRLLKEKADKLTQQLELSTESKELLMLRLQSAMDEVQRLNEYKDTCDTKCNDMALQNRVLETNFQKVTEENALLSQKITECETLMKDLEGYESKFQACSIEKLELENLLKKEVLENEILQDKISFLQEEMKAVRTEFDELASAKLTEKDFLLSEKISECETLKKDLGSYENKFQACFIEKLELENLLKKEVLENGNRQDKISSLQEEMNAFRTEFDELSFAKENLQSSLNFLQDKLQNLLAFYEVKYNGLSIWNESVCQGLESKDLKGAVMRLEELQRSACEKIFQLIQEKQDLGCERDVAQMSLNEAESDNLVIKKKFEADVRNVMGKLDVSSILMHKLQSEVEAIANRLKISSEAEENYEQHHTELLSAFDNLELELKQLTSENEDLAQGIMALQIVSEELERYKLGMEAFSDEREALMMKLKDKTEESAKLELELNSMRSNLQSLHDELHVERTIKSNLESRVTDLMSELNEKHRDLLTFDQQKAELVHLKQLVTDLELEKSSIFRTLSDSEKSLKAAREEFSSISCLEAHLSEMHEFSIASDVRLTVTKAQYESCIEELQKKYLSLESMLNSCLSTEARYTEENAKLMTSLNSLGSELDASIAQNRMLLDTNSSLRTELDELNKRAEDVEISSHVKTGKHALEVERLEGMLVKYEEEIDDLMLVKEELEVKLLVLKLKLDEQQPQIALVEEYKHELVTLQNKYNEVSHRLSEQVLKTEEFKNLSIHLKELKDKADAECLQAREKREPEGPPLAMQESLRIAFIKEQYETKLQEMKHQLSISKKHSEEMLWKLQDAINEVENRKKSEASHLKRNEELGMRILELETDLHSALSEKREIMRAYDLTKAEKECSLISLECCKEEKQDLEASLQKCNEEKSKIAVELSSVKDLLESSACEVNNQRRDSDGLHKAYCVSHEPVNGILTGKIPVSGNPSEPFAKFSKKNVSNDRQEVGPDHSDAVIKMQPKQDALTSESVSVSSVVQSSQEDLLQTDTKHLAIVNDHFKAQSLKSSMDHLNKQLERMKHENLLLSQDDCEFDPNSSVLQRELMQLQKVNQELGTVFPLFNEFSCNGNALERVLALEIELAESLQAKKSRVQFQSSFLKQHSDEEAVFKSFRDINELIKDMLETKGRYAAVETELKEMHDRYSQLSLQFAEVEGERQKLMMTLKNVRASKKVPFLNHSSTAPLGGPL